MTGFSKWLATWGFAALVAAAIVAGGLIAADVSVPTPVPNFALKAAAIYRIEVGAAAFLGLYLVAMAFVLALNNRGFSEIGMSGLKAQDLANRGQQRAIDAQEKALESVNTMVSELEAFTESSVEEVDQRLDELNAKVDGKDEK
jgi:hypothetical protein